MKKLLLGLVVLILLGAAIGSFVETTAPPKLPKTEAELARDLQITAAVAAARQLRQMMNDPKSFELTRAIVMADGTGCYEFRARNPFNALMPGQAVFDGSTIVTSNDQSGQFTRGWNARCAGKSGTPITAVSK